MSMAEKLVTVAENQDKVFDAGKKSVINELKEAQKGFASGEIISITDISPIEHTLGVKLSSKNLIPNTYKTATTKGVTFTVSEDGTITANGTASEAISLILILPTKPISVVNGEKYSFSGSPQGSSYSNYYMAIQSTDYVNTYNDVGSGITFTSNGKPLYLYISVQSGATLDNVVFKPMLEKGTVKTSYTPFVADVSQSTLSAAGKNLFNNDTSLIENVGYTTSAGVNASRYGYKITLPVGTYTIKPYDKRLPDDTYQYYIYGMVLNKDNIVASTALNTIVNNSFKTVTFTIKNGETFFLYDGETGDLSGAKRKFSQFDFQLEVGKSATDFEEFIEPVSYTPNADGTVEGVKSIYPNMTLMADTQGVLVECEYNKDTNKIFDDYVEGIL